ncbi:MAG: 23S rRNA pseudouridine(1911/1915/1917) synthase RluD [Pseudomonadales bacterium]|nr:23S rRNA pseudouridine(1911/1915/1917) synthase RluD [Pseudomonadales bacterium]
MDDKSHNLNATREATVPPELSGERLDKATALLFPEHSRAEITRWIQEGTVLLDGVQSKPKVRVKGGESVSLSAEAQVRDYWQEPEDIPLDIVHADDDILVLNKPAGLVVHPGAGNNTGTLVNALLFHYPDLSAVPRAGVVHRLDKETSGVMVVARNLATHHSLVEMIGARQVNREYLGLTEGRMISGRDVDEPIGRDPNVRTRQAVREDGKPAHTEFRVVERYRIHTLVRAKLGSGRTHQIRVHLKSIGYPLVGDKRYGARGKVPVAAATDLLTSLQALQQVGRQALHAERLNFVHPGTSQSLDFVVPLAQDLADLRNLLLADKE